MKEKCRASAICTGLNLADKANCCTLQASSSTLVGHFAGRMAPMLMVQNSDALLPLCVLAEDDGGVWELSSQRGHDLRGERGDRELS